jgi:hypothetical protein
VQLCAGDVRCAWAGPFQDAGTPVDAAKVKGSYTGQYLRELLGRRGANGRGKRQAAE